MVWGRAASADVLFSGSSDSTIKVPSCACLVPTRDCSLSQQVWQLADGNFRSGAVQTARRHQSGVSSLAVSTSGSRLVSCSSEGTIIWGVQANRITLLCSCCVPTFSAAPLSLDANDDIVLQVPSIAMRQFFDALLCLAGRRSGRLPHVVTGHDCVDSIVERQSWRCRRHKPGFDFYTSN